MIHARPTDRQEAPPRVICLLVDDLEENLLALSALLRRDDVELLRARSGTEALDLLLKHDVALAIVDVQMPDMDGFELAELMRGSERTRHVPLIFVTAGGRDQHRLFKGYETGAVDFLYKPIEPHILKNKADVFFELYRQKQQLVRELRERTETLRLNEMFAAVLGHDLRTPLGVIVTGATLLERRLEDEALRQTAARMISSGKRMTRMIEDLLDLTRARLAGGIPLVRSQTDLGAIVDRVVQEHQIASAARRIDVTKEGDLSGEWDPERLAQVAANLLGNAIAHGDPAMPICVQIDGRAAERVTFAVINGGCIDLDVLPSLFDPFRDRDRDAHRARTGLGLGLYIAQQIVLAHYGGIDVQSGDAGSMLTVFRVTVPRRIAPSVRAPTPAENPAASS